MQLLPIALTATVAGLSLAPIYSVPQWQGGLFVASCLLLSYLLRKSGRLVLIFLFVGFFLFSNLRYPSLLPTNRDISHLDSLGRKVTVTGTLIDIRQLTDGRCRFDLLVDSVKEKSQPIPLTSSLRVRVYLEQGTDRLFPGDIVRFSSRLRQPRLFGTPGEFNWPRYLASQQIDMTAWTRSPEHLDILDRQAYFPDRQIVKWRSKIAAAIQNAMAENRALLVRALVLGEGRVIPDQVRQVLARSGISHLFAISGLHLGLIALLGYRILLGIYRRSPRLLDWQPPQKILPLIIVPVLLGYLLLTGDAVSTRRAFALAVVAAVFLFCRYSVNPLFLLATLALFSLSVNPLLLWQAGWQLSFCGAAGILLWRPLWQARMTYLPVLLRYPLQLFLVTFAATLATLPLVLFNFHLFAPAGIIANLICVPVVTLFALPIGFLGLLVYPFIPQLAEHAFLLCGYLLDCITVAAGWLITVPGLEGYYLFLTRWQYLALGMFVLPPLLFVQLPKKTKSALMAIVFLSGVILWQLPLSMAPPVSLTMFSVGQGEALLLQNKNGQAIMIDGGGLPSERFDVGERLLAPALGDLRVNRLDAVVLTHDHPDHRKGLIFILDQFPVQEFWSGHGLSELHPALREVLKRKNIQIKTVDSGWSQLPVWSFGVLNIFNGATVTSNENDSSLALYLGSQDHGGLLLTGDLEQQGVSELLSAGLPGPVSLLKLPHHGSKYSKTDRLVDQLTPNDCLVSAGYQNHYHLPARPVVDFLRDRNIPLHRTDLQGTVQARLSDSGWQVKHWERGLFR